MTDDVIPSNQQIGYEAAIKARDKALKKLRAQVKELEHALRLERALFNSRDEAVESLKKELAALKQRPVYIWMNPYTLELSDHPRENYKALCLAFEPEQP